MELMNRFKIVYFLIGMCPAVAGAGSVEVDSAVGELKEQLRQANEAYEQASEQHQKTVESINLRLRALEGDAGLTNQALPTGQPTSGAGVSEAGTDPWSPVDPVRVGGSQAYMDIGLIGTFAAGGSTADDIEGGTQLGGHDPNQRGFTVQGIELNLNGGVDPYFRGNATMAFGVDSGGDSYVEVEEGWLETVALPFNLRVRAGQLLTEFGRMNATHVHAWDFVDTPLVNGRFLGPDGLRNPGAQLSWLAPTPFFTELTFGVQNSGGATATSFRGGGGHSHGGEDEEELPFAYRHPDNDRGVQGFGDLLLTPRLATSFDLSEEVTMLWGVSGAFGPNGIGGETGDDTRTEIYGADLTLKWKSVRHHGGFPFVKWQTEGMLRRTDVGAFDWADEGTAADPGIVLEGGAPAVLSRETLTDYGFYSQVVYGFRKGWTLGVRFDWLEGDTAGYEAQGLTVDGEALGRDPFRRSRWRVSPSLTWYPTEFSKIRLQYNYDDRQGVGVDHSIWLQFEFILGAHAAHTF